MPNLSRLCAKRTFIKLLLWLIIWNNAKNTKDGEEILRYQSQMTNSKFLENLIAGSCDKMQEVRQHIALAAPYPVNVLAIGPTGSGKELIAKGIHKLSARTGKFIAVNAAAIPAELLEAELFGYEKGAFTGADKSRKGKVEEAANGTLFLDEIGDMPFSLQAKLLRVLETKTVQKIGSEKSIPVDFRLVCATHTDIGELARQGKFRADLLYRIAVYTIENPPLAERTEDLEELMTVLSMRLKKTETKIKPATFDAEAMGFLRAYSWPGNIRELANFLQKCSVLFSGQTLSVEKIKPLMPNFETGEPSEVTQASLWDDPPVSSQPAERLTLSNGFDASNINNFSDYFSSNQPLNLRQFLSDMEEKLITSALQQSDGSVESAAQKLGLSSEDLLEKIKLYAVMNRSLGK